MSKSLLVLVCLASIGFAQTPSDLQPYYKAGDTLRYVVTFDGDPDFSSVSLYFGTNNVPADQAGLSNNFGISQTHKIGPGKFEVEGTIPSNAVTGTYELRDVQPRIPPAGVKDYDATQFHESVRVVNPARYNFPPLKGVVPK